MRKAQRRYGIIRDGPGKRVGDNGEPGGIAGTPCGTKIGAGDLSRQCAAGAYPNRSATTPSTLTGKVRTCGVRFRIVRK